jgi:hypothetical protein
VTNRELSMIIDNPNPSLLLSTSEVLGGKYQSNALLRTITLLVLTQKIKNLSKKRYDAILSRKEVENDAVECGRKKSYEKLKKSLELINRLFGYNDEDEKEFLIDGNLSANVSVSVSTVLCDI